MPFPGNEIRVDLPPDIRSMSSLVSLVLAKFAGGRSGSLRLCSVDMKFYSEVRNRSISDGFIVLIRSLQAAS